MPEVCYSTIRRKITLCVDQKPLGIPWKPMVDHGKKCEGHK